ncbi:MAG: AAA family ATPase [Deltaproteobacteria bacterium]|nr:AAA family ATPase [Deltaproteobacteria bacterium]
MAQQPEVVIVGAREQELEALRPHILDMVNIRAAEQDPQKALALIQKEPPSIALLYLDHDPQAIFGVSQQISRLDGCVSMIVSRDRDPEKILAAMRAGAKEYAFLDEGAGDVRRAIRDLNVRDAEPAVAASQPAAARQGVIIAVFACKGGSGATTIATNLAGALLESDEDERNAVVIVDLNQQLGDVLSFLDLTARYTLHDVVSNMRRLDRELLMQSLTQHTSGLYAVAQGDNLDETAEVDSKGTAQLLGLLRKHFDYVVVDGLRDFNENALVALDLANKILLTITQDIPSVKNANRCLAVFKRLGYGPDKLKPVLNRYARGTKLDPDSIGDALNTPIVGTVCNDFPTVIKAVNDGNLLVKAAPKARVTLDIQGLVPLVGGTSRQKRRGLFGFLGK